MPGAIWTRSWKRPPRSWPSAASARPWRPLPSGRAWGSALSTGASLTAPRRRHYVTSVNQAVEAAVTSTSDAWSAIRDFVDWVAEPGRGALAAALAELPEETLADMEEFEEDQRRWVQQLDELVRRAQADCMMRPDVSAEDLVHLLDVFTCHPDALPTPVAAQPTKYLHLVLDGMQAAVATPLPAPPG